MLSSRLGSKPDVGLARVRSHSGLEYFLYHPGHGHSKAEDVTTQRLLLMSGRQVRPTGQQTSWAFSSVDRLMQRRDESFL